MKQKIAVLVAVLSLLAGSQVQAFGGAGETWDDHEIDVSLHAGVAFPTNFNTAGVDVDDVTFALGLDADVQLWEFLYGGFDFAFIPIGFKVGTASGRYDTFALSFHAKAKYVLPWGDENWRIVPAFGMGPTVTSASIAGLSADDTVFGLNFGLDAEYLWNDEFFVGPTYRSYAVFDSDDTFMVHTIGLKAGMRF
ncbi:MAG: outer membrane beta-barrel protein [Deltaproteobacteria bacterium]|nr:outer membrane beta-barrel protein [Deltaproteobacteria bacterium]